MIPRQKFETCAENIAKCVNIKPKECIYIRGNSCYQDIAEEVALNVLRYDGNPFLNLMSDNFFDIMFKDDGIKVETIDRTPKHILKLTENIDIRITFDFYEDPSIRERASKEKREAIYHSFMRLNPIVLGSEEKYTPGKKWLYVGWPTKSAAKAFNINYELFESFLVNGISIPYEEMDKITKELKSKFVNADKIHIKDNFGTDFYVKVKDRKCGRDIGRITDHNIGKGILGSNLPAGEVGFATHEQLGEGTLFCPLTRDPLTRKEIKNLKLHFKDGKLILEKITADTDVEEFISTLRYFEEADKKTNYPDLRTYNIAELGIGCNPEITKAIGYVLTDEKINGTIHLAFGSNEHFGGTSRSNLHWDFVSTPGVNIIVEDTEGNKKLVMENGKVI